LLTRIQPQISKIKKREALQLLGWQKFDAVEEYQVSKFPAPIEVIFLVGAWVLRFQITFEVSLDHSAGEAMAGP